jgi:hypothetical protein
MPLKLDKRASNALDDTQHDLSSGLQCKNMMIINDYCRLYHKLEHHSKVTNYAPRVINYAPRAINYAPRAINYALKELYSTVINHDDHHMTFVIGL